ncbi:MAG: hydrogenase maturation protease [Bacteroidetes bacterium]|nr:hydrogenase maturation protease [Bacteroidota bacterium]
MSSVLVVGYGNTLRADDGAGVRAAEFIAQQYPQINVLCVHQLTPEIAEVLSRVSLAFFLDADFTSNSVKITPITEPPWKYRHNSHVATPHDLLALSAHLYGTYPRKTFIVSIPACSVMFSETLSPQTQQFVEEAVLLVTKLISEETTSGKV